MEILDDVLLEKVLADFRGIPSTAGVGEESLVEASVDLDEDKIHVLQGFSVERLPFVQGAENGQASRAFHQGVQSATLGVEA